MKDLTIAIYIGKILSREDVDFVSALDVQAEIAEDVSNGGHRLEASVIRTVLDVLTLAEFLYKIDNGKDSLYSIKNKNITNVSVTRVSPEFIIPTNLLLRGDDNV